MAHTFTQLYIHLVFAVQGRQSLIQNSFKSELCKYITGIVQRPDRGHKLIAINGPANHIHILIGLNPDQTIADLVRDIKISSSKLINSRGWTRGRFRWQEGYGAFSNSRSQLQAVARYIERQEELHKRFTFHEEYLGLLDRYAVLYDRRYLFEWVDDDVPEE
ncbi:MAG TPA: IS200/IS605 family transposase [Candidatus Kapabacteria bacterium]|nr:IS200/IS605 family transposase [Candidatus Kapabacteria bacterium]